MQEFKEVPVEFNQIKVGDWVRLKSWEDFYEVSFASSSAIKVKYDSDFARYGDHVKGQWYKKEEIMQGCTNGVDAPQNETTQEPLFKVGDVVWDVLYGKGVVDRIEEQAINSVVVRFETAQLSCYNSSGKMSPFMQRTLFFSEPKIEALTERPFQSKLIGKSVVITLVGGSKYLEKVYAEDATRIFTEPEGVYGNCWSKKDLDAVYEISSENLLVKG